MASDDAQYESKSVTALPFTEDKTIAKLEAGGWELVGRHQQFLSTQLEFRRAIPRQSRWQWLVWAVAILGVVTAFTVGIIHERSVAGATGATQPPAATEVAPEPAPSASTPTETTKPEDGEVDGSDGGARSVRWKDAPTDGVWPRGDIGFGETYTWGGGYELSVVGSPWVVTEDGGESVTVSSSFLATPTTEDTTSLSWIDVRFWEGDDPERSVNDDYGEAEWECSPSGSDEDETETCTATFTPDDPSEVEDFFWTLDGVSFGAWPSQTGSVADGYHWVKVSSVTATGAATGKPFKVKGHVRARYSFDFEPDPTYSYGDIGLRFVEDGGCKGAKDAAERRVNEQKGVLNFGFMSGKYCGSVYMPGPIWDRGTVKVTYEELRPK